MALPAGTRTPSRLRLLACLCSMPRHSPRCCLTSWAGRAALRQQCRGGCARLVQRDALHRGSFSLPSAATCMSQIPNNRDAISALHKTTCINGCACPCRDMCPVSDSAQTPLSTLLSTGTAGDRMRPELSQLLGLNLSQVLERTKTSLDSLSRDLREASSGIVAGRPLEASIGAQHLKPLPASAPGTKGLTSAGMESRARVSFAGKENSSVVGHRDRLRTQLQSHDPPTKPNQGACIQQVGVELGQWMDHVHWCVSVHN